MFERCHACAQQRNIKIPPKTKITPVICTYKGWNPRWHWCTSIITLSRTHCLKIYTWVSFLYNHCTHTTILRKFYSSFFITSLSNRVENRMCSIFPLILCVRSNFFLFVKKSYTFSHLFVFVFPFTDKQHYFMRVCSNSCTKKKKKNTKQSKKPKTKHKMVIDVIVSFRSSCGLLFGSVTGEKR